MATLGCTKRQLESGVRKPREFVTVETSNVMLTCDTRA